MKILRYENLDIYICDDSEGVFIKVYPTGCANGDSPLAECEATFDDAATVQAAVGVPVFRTGGAVMAYEDISDDSILDETSGEPVPEGTEGTLTRIFNNPFPGAEGWVQFPGRCNLVSVKFDQLVPVE